MERAKGGDREAIRYWKEQRARIWKQKEVDAVNYFLSHRREFDLAEKVLVGKSIWLRRNIYNGMQQAEAVSGKLIGDYMLLFCTYDDGVESFWMSKLDKEEGIIPVADVTMWHGKHY